MDINQPTSSKKPGFFEIYEEFKFEMKQLLDFLVLTNAKNAKVFNSHLFKMSEFLEELLNHHVSLLSRFEKLENQHFFELKELKLSLKNRNKQKKTALKLQMHQIETFSQSLKQELELKNNNIAELRMAFDENLKTEKKLQKTMEFWFKRQLQKVQLNLQELKFNENQGFSQEITAILYKVKKYQSNFPWKPSISPDFSIATTPFSNYSVISLNSMSKSPRNSVSNLNKAFYIISSQKMMREFERTPKNFFKDTMTVTQKEELLLRLIKDNNTEENESMVNQRHSVKLEDILNVSNKSNENSSIDCEFLREVEKKKDHNNEDKRKLPPNSLEKLLKTMDFTGKLSERHHTEEMIETNKNVIKDLNREIYQHLGETLNFSQSSVKEKSKEIIEFQVEGFKMKEANKNNNFHEKFNLKKVPKLNLEKVMNKEEDCKHSFSPSYRKKAERSQYLKQMFEEKRQTPCKRIKQTNKSMDFSNNNNNKPMNFHYLQSRINEKTNKFICNLLQNPRKHAKNNYSLIENSTKEDLSFINNKNNIRINEILRKNEETAQQTLNDKTNFLNIVAPTNNINVYISNEFEEKEGNKPKKKNNRLMKLLSQVNQNRKEGRFMKENIPGEGELSMGNIKEFALLQKMRNCKKK